jgi:hypothetical protein
VTYPRQAIEACEALSHPLPHPTMPIDHSTTDDRITEWLHQADGGAKVNTQHPGPIEMHEPSDTPAAVDVAAFGYLLMLVVGILAALVIVSVAGPLIEHLPELMGATAK